MKIHKVLISYILVLSFFNAGITYAAKKHHYNVSYTIENNTGDNLDFYLLFDTKKQPKTFKTKLYGDDNRKTIYLSNFPEKMRTSILIKNPNQSGKYLPSSSALDYNNFVEQLNKIASKKRQVNIVIEKDTADGNDQYILFGVSKDRLERTGNLNLVNFTQAEYDSSGSELKDIVLVAGIAAIMLILVCVPFAGEAADAELAVEDAELADYGTFLRYDSFSGNLITADGEGGEVEVLDQSLNDGSGW